MKKDAVFSQSFSEKVNHCHIKKVWQIHFEIFWQRSFGNSYTLAA